MPTADNAPSKIKVKIADFGIFGSTKGEQGERINAGSLKYMAPELFKGKTESSEKLDVWSLGVMLYSMIIGDYPFSHADKAILRKQILEKEIVFDLSGFGISLKRGKTSKV